MGLRTLPLDVFKQATLPHVPGFNPLLRPSKHCQQTFGIATQTIGESRHRAAGTGWSIALDQNVVVERHVLPPGAGVPLSAAPADDLPDDPR